MLWETRLLRCRLTIYLCVVVYYSSLCLECPVGTVLRIWYWDVLYGRLMIRIVCCRRYGILDSR
jgi:hypothetical protein